MSNSNSIPLPTNPRFQDLTGHVFGRLTVTGYAGKAGNRTSLWLVACECGTTREVRSVHLKGGHTRSCGCLKDEAGALRLTTHGHCRAPEYRVWYDMWYRCTNPKSESYTLYKDRAPPVEWRSFETFFTELGPRPGPGFSLDRIDNEKPYGPGNCRWTTPATQSRNTSTNVWVTTPDGALRTMLDACRLVGIPYTTVYCRRQRGQTLEEASNGLLREAA